MRPVRLTQADTTSAVTLEDVRMMTAHRIAVRPNGTFTPPCRYTILNLRTMKTQPITFLWASDAYTFGYRLESRGYIRGGEWRVIKVKA
jgi:hypothetical protein